MEDKKRIRVRDDYNSSYNKNRRVSYNIDVPKPKISKRKFDFSIDPSEALNLKGPVDISISTPSEEIVRAHIILKCRDKYVSLTKHAISVTPPIESFNRLLFAMLTLSGDRADPLVCDPDMSFNSDVLINEIIPSLPRFFKVKCTNLSVGLDIIQQIKDSVKDVLKDKCTAELMQDLFPSTPSSPEEVIELFTDLKRKFPPLFRDLLTDDLNELVFTPLADFMKASLSELKRISGILKCRVKVSFHSNSVSVNPNVSDFNVDERASTPLSLSRTYYEKLRAMHSKFGGDRCFEDDLFCLLRRYQTLFGSNARIGANFHSSIPESIFEYLARKCQTGVELFSSPLNNYFARFCSAFPDVDAPFGSLGSFFDLNITEGSFQICPPFTSQMMDRMAEKVIECLQNTDKPLAFQIFVPEWRDPPSLYHELLDNTAFKKGLATFKNREHHFVNGRQFAIVSDDDNSVEDPYNGNSRLWLCRHTTLVYLLANDAGLEKYYENDASNIAMSIENIMVGKDEVASSEEVCQF